MDGQPVALVLADTQEEADHAASLVRAIYLAEPAVTMLAASKAAGLHATQFIGESLEVKINDAEAALAANNMPEPFIAGSMSAYAAGAFKLSVEAAYLDMLANTFMRAPGESVGTFALESAFDELAAKLGMDPIALRLRNEPDTDPVKGLPFSSREVALAYKMGAERFGWDKRSATPGGWREGEWLVGLGVATSTYPYQRMPGGAARITLTREGHATVAIAAHEIGMGTSTTYAMVAADRLGLPIERVTVDYGASSLPGVVLAGGSQQTVSIGAAVIAAHRQLVGELIKLAGNDSPLAGLKPEEVGGRDGGLCKLASGDPELRAFRDQAPRRLARSSKLSVIRSI